MKSFICQKSNEIQLYLPEINGVFVEEFFDEFLFEENYCIVKLSESNLICINRFINATNIFFSNEDLYYIFEFLSKKCCFFDILFNLIPSKRKIFLNIPIGINFQNDSHFLKNNIFITPASLIRSFNPKNINKTYSFHNFFLRKKYLNENIYKKFVFFEASFFNFKKYLSFFNNRSYSLFFYSFVKKDIEFLEKINTDYNSFNITKLADFYFENKH
jgi:hypothetical protein